MADISLDLDDIANGAEESLKFIKKWKHVASKHPVVVLFSQDIRMQGYAYSIALDNSITTADKGCGYCRTAIYLCEIMISSSSINPQELSDYVKEMREVALHAGTEITKATDMFRRIRTEQCRVLGSIKKEFRNDTYKDLVESQIIECIEDAARGLGALFNSVDALANWWLDMDTTLKIIQSSSQAGESQTLKISSLRLRSIQTRWDEVDIKYQNYKLKIARLRDVYRTDDTKESRGEIDIKKIAEVAADWAKVTAVQVKRVVTDAGQRLINNFGQSL